MLQRLLHDPLFAVAFLLPLPLWLVASWHGLQPQWLLLLVLAPILEETVFRGAIQGWLLRRWPLQFRGVSLANVITAILFALAHAMLTSLYGIFTLFPALIFGFFRDRYQSLIPAMVLHSYYNCGPAFGWHWQ